MNRTYSLAGMMLACSSCCIRNLRYDDVVDAPPAKPIGAIVSAPPILAANVLGHATISTRVYAADSSCCGDDTKAGNPGEDIKISDARRGQENKKCGDIMQSGATAIAEFRPRMQPDTRTYGFSIAVDTWGRGGHWQDQFVFCTNVHDETGIASASTEGTIEMTFKANNPGQVADDKLLIRIEGSGSVDTSMRLTDSSGAVLPLSVLSNGATLVAPVKTPGQYTLQAELHSRDADSGGCSFCESRTVKQTFVSVQTLRDALQLGYGNVVSPTLTVPAFAHIPVAALEEELTKELFTDQGKFFPCRQNKDCPEAADVYLEYPHLKAKGSWLTLSSHLAGRVYEFIIPIGLTGDILLAARPDMENATTLVFRDVTLETHSRDWVFNYVSGNLGARIVKMISQKARRDVTQFYDKAYTYIRKAFPIRWGNYYLDLDMQSINVKEFTVDEQAQEVVALIEVKLKYENALQAPARSPAAIAAVPNAARRIRPIETRLKSTFPMREVFELAMPNTMDHPETPGPER